MLGAFEYKLYTVNCLTLVSLLSINNSFLAVKSKNKSLSFRHITIVGPCPLMHALLVEVLLL